MAGSSLDYVQLIQPYLSQTLVSQAAMERIASAARLLPPITPAGFECRLGDESHQVDFQLGIRFQGDEPARLAAYLAAAKNAGILPDHPAWQRVFAFCVDWGSEDWHNVLEDLWLELDFDASSTLFLTPSVFLGFKSTIPHESRFSIAVKAMESLLGEPPSLPLLANLRRCFEACPEPAYVSHVGLMLARQVQAVRVNVSHIPIPHLFAYLHAAGLQEDQAAEEVESLVRWLYNFVDHVRLALDVGACVYPQVGLECYYARQSGLDYRWAPFLQALVDRGLCSEGKRAALLDWPGYINPTTVSLWPVASILQALTEPETNFDLLDRRLSHLKMVYRPHHPLEVKAYLGYIQIWVTPDAQGAPKVAGPLATPDLTPRPLPAARPLDRIDSLEQAIDGAVTFLVSVSNGGGWWLDFDTFPEGPSDEWVTAYVALALAGTQHPAAREAALQGWQRLVQRYHRDTGWGYNIVSPPDADTTEWCLQLAMELDVVEDARLCAAYEFLGQHLLSFQKGGSHYKSIATYRPDHFAHFNHLEPVDLGDWARAHTCVAAPVALLQRFRPILSPYLCAVQRRDGAWEAYWWDDHEYATAFAVDALSQSNKSEEYQAAMRGAAWSAERIGAEGVVFSTALNADSAFATALAARAVAAMPFVPAHQSALFRASRWLINHQFPDGSWETSARLLLPPRHAATVEEKLANTQVFLDHRRIFTTATVLFALSRIHALVMPSHV